SSHRTAGLSGSSGSMWSMVALGDLSESTLPRLAGGQVSVAPGSGSGSGSGTGSGSGSGVGMAVPSSPLIGSSSRAETVQAEARSRAARRRRIARALVQPGCQNEKARANAGLVLSWGLAALGSGARVAGSPAAGTLSHHAGGSSSTVYEVSNGTLSMVAPQ